MEFSELIKNKHVNIAIAGIIGVGKTTCAKKLSEKYEIEVSYEPVDEGNLLKLFYGDMHRWSFPFQISILHKRFRLYKKHFFQGKHIVHDRSIYEDVIFAKMLTDSGHIHEEEFKIYSECFANMTEEMKPPDLIVFLNCTPEKALERARKRARDCECKLTIEYLTALNDNYREWLDKISDKVPILIVEWEEDFLPEDQIVEQINNMLEIHLKERPPSQAIKNVTNLQN